MYTQQQSQTVRAMGNWLGKTKWETFSTITYRYDIKEKQNYRIMKGLERYLERLKKPFNLFWVTEFTNYDYNTHNHLLVKGDIVRDIECHLKSKSLIGKHVKHEPYRKESSMYVSKFICDTKTNWGLVNNA